MDRVPQVIRRSPVLLLALLPFAVGCAGMHEARHSALQKLGIEPPAPAVYFECAWQNRLSELPDPTKNGATIAGLPGQMYLYTADYKFAQPNGDLTLVISDETPRPQGATRKREQLWHFDKSKLEKMQSEDERWTRNYVLFLPFPTDTDPASNWRDVSRVRIKARYDHTVDGQKQTLYAQEVVVTLDFVKTPTGTGLWKPIGPGGTNGGIPDPYAVMNQMRSNGQTQAGANWPQTGNLPGNPQTMPAGSSQQQSGVPSATQPMNMLTTQPANAQPMWGSQSQQQPVNNQTVPAGYYQPGNVPSATQPMNPQSNPQSMWGSQPTVPRAPQLVVPAGGMMVPANLP